ncbi:MAG: autotransporter-associated beta strand repeat-containing protein, partial [Akkermansiaceae bacterium]|nr:autotransporter-associated beta strand repeat-containing protein [Verrucomicrobiales bacterium]
NADFSQVNLTADRTVTLDTARSVGGLRFGATSGSTFNWFLASSGGSILTLDTGAPTAPVLAVNQNTATLNLPLSSAYGLTKTGAGTLVLGGTNALVGPLSLNAGALSFLSLSNLPLAFDAVSSIDFRGGTLQWAAGNTVDISSLGVPINFFGNAGFDTSGNNVSFANGFGDSGVGGLIKLGAGTLTLNGGVAYMGTTTVSNGVLALGASASIGSSTNIIVRNGGTLNVSAMAGGLTLNQNLSGAGTVVGNLANGASIILAPGPGTATLTVNGNLTLNGGGVLNYDLSNVTTAGSGVNDMMAVTGDLNIAGPTTLNINLINGAPGLGTYTLFTYNTFSGSVANLTVPLGFSVTNDTVGKTIGLVVTHIPASLTWQGDGLANLWDIGTTANWLQSGTNQQFFTGDSVTFDNAGSSTPAIDISGNVSPASVTVNASQDYNFAGVGAIITGSLAKSGAGTLVLENNNTYSGPTLINSGVLQVGGATLGGAAGSLGSGVVTNNGALVFNLAIDSAVNTNIFGSGSISNIGSAGTVTLGGNIRGSTVTMAGAGSMVLSGSNSYTGQTLISAGSLQANHASALGTAAAGTVVSDGGQLYINANVNLSGETLSLAGVGGGTGALRKGGNGTTSIGSVITLAGDTQLQVDGGSTLNLTNAAGITGIAGAPSTNLTLAGPANGFGNITGPLMLGSGSLTKNGAGTWTIARTNTYTGLTFINGGTLQIAAPTALGPVTTFTPAYVTLNGGTLGVTTTNVTFNDGLGGFSIGTAGGFFDVGFGYTLTISNEISGAGAITKINNSGTLVLSGANPSFTGTLFVDRGAAIGEAGRVIIAHPNAVVSAASPIPLRNNNGATATLGLDGTNGNITLTQDITFNGWSPSIPAILNIAGSNTIAGIITASDGGPSYRIQSDNGLLTLTSNLIFATTSPQTFTFQGNGSHYVSGVIGDGPGGATSIRKDGNGRLTLGGVNTNSGTTTVTGGTLIVDGTTAAGAVTVSGGSLGGNGTINGAVSIGAGGTLSPGSSIGTLTINNSLTLAGNTFVEVNKTSGQRDQVAGLTSVAYGGTLTVSNLSGTLAPGDNFQIFPATAFTGNFTGISSAPSGVTWNFNPASGVLTVASVMASTPTNITFKVTGNTLTLGWPEDYRGWILQSQTNALSVGLSTNWADVSGSGSVTNQVITINPAAPAVFFRLRNP